MFGARARRALLGAALAALAAACGCADTSNNASVGAGGADGGVDTASVSTDQAGYLWYAGAALNAFTQAETAASNDDGPARSVLPDHPATRFHDLAFDRDGNLWTLPLSGDQIVRVPVTQLENASKPRPDLIIQSPALVGAQSLAFDQAGNLWVLNASGTDTAVASVARFEDPRAQSGNATLGPGAIIRPGSDANSVGRFRQATAIAVDAAGNLWMAAITNVLRFDAASDLHGIVSPEPSAILASGDAYVSIAFDAAGALWITGATGGYFAERIPNPGALSGAVVPVAAARLHLPAADSLFASGMGFDADGALWVAMSKRIIKLTAPGALTGDVSPEAAVALELKVDPDLASKILFRPAPAGLPLY